SFRDEDVKSGAATYRASCKIQLARRISPSLGVVSGRGSGGRGPELRDAEYLIDGERDDAEHEVAFDLHLTLIAPRTRTTRAPNWSFSRALTRSAMVRKSKSRSSGSGMWMSFMRSTSLAHSALASCWARKLRSMIGAWPSALLWSWMAAAS